MEQLTLEEAMKRLEEITAQMEQEALPLTDMMRLYEEGVKLQEHCTKLLDLAEKQVQVLNGGEVDES